jgi:Fanconi anemia group M protein
MPLLDIFSKPEKSKKEKKPEEKPRIIADKHEKNSLVIAELAEQGAEVSFEHLKVADFIVKDVAIERKTIPDFWNSMINKRLSQQLEEIRQYPNCLLIIEGIEEHELYPEQDGINPNALRGFLLSILLNYKVPILFTKDYKDTASFLLVLAKKQKHETGIRAVKKAFSKKEQLQYILEGFPGIGPKTAKKLLKKYKTIKAIINLPSEELKKEIGKKAEIFKLLEEEY